MITQFQGEYRWLSNFASVKIIYGPWTFQSVEHAYMAMKSHDPEWKEFCTSCKSPSLVKKKSKYVKLIDNWEKEKVKYMKEFLNQKFNQEPFKTKLIRTGNQHISEGNLWNDTFWGVCLKLNSGQNKLGRLIMEVRENLK